MLKGMEMSRMFYEECGKPIIDSDFAPYKKYLAFGLVGQGSECLFYDDEISRDHDFAPGFCIWLPERLMNDIGIKLREAYDKLFVQEFLMKHKEEFNLNIRDVYMTGAREKRIGVHSIEEFYYEHTGIASKPKTFDDWTKTHPMFLSEAVNGEVFDDYYGEFTDIRNVWLNYYPIDILKKKVAANIGMAGKTGQFNYSRSLKRGDMMAAYECATLFIHRIVATIYLLNRKYMPYYKWVFKGMEGFEICKEAVPLLKELTQMSEKESTKKIDYIERISAMVIEELKRRSWTDGRTDYLLDHARLVVKTIDDKIIANMNIFVGEDY